MKNTYTIMRLDKEHIEEICQDIKYQNDNNIANCALFEFVLVPEGIPCIDKAKQQGEIYKLLRDRLAQMNIECGILVQCSIGHGYKLDAEAEFQHYVELETGNPNNVYCPYDDGFREYIRNQLATIASLRPQVIMIDDDFRLMFRDGKGCVCPKHLAEFNRIAGTNLGQKELMEILSGGDERTEEYTNIFVETQRDALLGGAKAMREGIDSVDPMLPGLFCCVGHTTEFAGEIAQILAGKGNPSVVRINNGNYTPEGARYLSSNAFRIAQQREMLKDTTDIILAETDTCPQNRYSTGAQSLHAHYTISILEGAQGAKHWITRLSAFEPNSGKAYRKKLSENSGFYQKLMEIFPTLKWFGCRIPLAKKPDYGFTHEGWYIMKTQWARCVLERFGFPIYFSSTPTGAAFLDGDVAPCFTDEEITDMLKGTLFLSSDAANVLIERGFKEYIGVEVKPWSLSNPSYEKLEINGNHCSSQMGIMELIPLSDQVEWDSTVCHLENGNQEVPLCPGTTVYKNSLGGTVIVFCGTPKAKFLYYEAFSFLNESRKAQFTRLLKQSGNIPIYYPEDSEILLKAAEADDGSIVCAVFNISLDPLEQIPLSTEFRFKEAYRLNQKGEFQSVELIGRGENLIVDTPAYTLEPVILKLIRE